MQKKVSGFKIETVTQLCCFSDACLQIVINNESYIFSKSLCIQHFIILSYFSVVNLDAALGYAFVNLILGMSLCVMETPYSSI